MRVFRWVPGLCGLVLVTSLATMTTWWGAIEMFRPGRPPGEEHRLAYLVPAAIFVPLAGVAARWPRGGGVFLATVGGAFYLLWGQVFSNTIGFWLGGLCILAGALFVWEARLAAERGQTRIVSGRASWWIRRWRPLCALGVPLLVLAGVVIERAV